MPFPGVVSAGLVNALRGVGGVLPGPRYHAAQYLSLCPNRVMMKSTLAATPAGNTGYAALTFGTVTEGATGNVAVGMLVLVGTADDPRAATWRGRVRADISGSTLYINETSAALTSGQYVWVIEDYPVVERLARDDGAGSYTKDYSVTFRELLPQVYGLQHTYAGFVDAASSYFRVAFSISRYATTSGGATPSVAWTFPAGAVVVSGATNAAAVTMDFPASAGDWCGVTVTENGRANTVHFIVFPHNRTSYPPALGFSGASIEGSVDGGWTASVEAFDGIDDVLDQTLCCVWDEEWYNGTKGALFGSVAAGYEVKFAGRLRTEADATSVGLDYGLVPTTRYTIEGLGAQLARIVAPLIAMRDDATPTGWDEINALTPWREIVHVLCEHSTALQTTSISFDSVADTYREDKVGTQSGSILAACNALAEGINAHLVFTPQGEIYVARDARYQTTAQRNALTTVANWNAADWLDFALEIDHSQPYGSCTASGGTYFPASGQVFPYEAYAPGVVPDGGSSEGDLSRQVLQNSLSAGAAKEELGDRAGDHWAKLNTSTRMRVTHPDGYNWLTPRLDAWYTFTIAADENSAGRAFTTSDRWLLVRVAIEHSNETGQKNVTAQYELETDGPRGVAYEPATGDVDDYLPFLPPFDPYDGLGGDFSWVLPDAGVDDTLPIGSDPNLPSTVISTGDLVVVTDGAGVYRTVNFIKGGTAPNWTDITPPDTTNVTGLAFDHTRTDGKVGLYALGNDGTDSYVDYLADVMGAPEDFTRGATLQGIYQSVRVMDAPGQVEVYAPSLTGEGGEGSLLMDFTVSDYGWTNRAPTRPFGVWTAGVGWVSVLGAVGSDYDQRLYLERIFSPTVTLTKITLNTSHSGPSGPLDNHTMATGPTLRTAVDNTPSDGDPLVIDIGGAGEAVGVISTSWVNDSDDGQMVVTSCLIEGSNLSDFVAAVQYSDDYGATFSTDPLSSSGGVGGFDCARLGDVTLAAGDGLTYKATAKGGTYASAGTDGATTGAQPVLLMYPWYLRNSSTVKNFSTATPDYLLGSSALVSSECLWWVAGSGGRTDITPSGATAAAGPDCTATYYGTKVAAIMLVGSTYTLFTSTDGGSNWSDRGALTSGSKYVRFRRVGGNGNQLYVADGANIKYSGNPHAATPTWTTKTGPSGVALVALEPWG